MVGWVELFDEAFGVSPGVEVGSDVLLDLVRGGGIGLDLVEECGDGGDGLCAFIVGPGLPAGSCFGGVCLEFFFDLGSEFHHVHEEAVGEGFVFGGGAGGELEHEVGSCFVVQKCVAGLVEGGGVECGGI